MTTKRNFLHMPPGNGTPVMKPRIVIEIDPVKGGSMLKTYGTVSFPMVIDALMAQQASVWAQFIKSMTTSLTGPDGQPALNPKQSNMQESEPETDSLPERQTPHDYTFQGDE